MTEGADNSKTRKRGRRGGRKPKNIDEGQQIQPVTEFTSEKEPTNNNYSFEPIDLNSQFPQIPVDLMDYFMNIEKMIREPAFETDEEQSLFSQNVLKEINGFEPSLCADPACSRLMELFLKTLSSEQIKTFFVKLLGNAKALICHQFASHVFQTVLVSLGDVVDRETLDDPENELSSSAAKLIQTLCEELQGEWLHLLPDTYGTHVARTLLNLLSGDVLVKDESQMRSKKSSKYLSKTRGDIVEPEIAPNKKTKVAKKVPSYFPRLLKDIVNEINGLLDSVRAERWAVAPNTSPVFQLLISIKGDGESFLRQLLYKEGSLNITLIQKLCSDAVGSHLLQKVIEIIPEDIYSDLFKSVFAGHFAELNRDRISNFLVQSMIQQCPQKKLAKVILDELLPEAKTMLKYNRSGVLYSLVLLGKKHECQQQEIFENVLAAIGHTETFGYEMIKAIYTLGSSESEKPVIQGSLILQALVHYAADISNRIAEGFIKTPIDQLIKWMTNAVAARGPEECIKSTSVQKKLKRQLVDLTKEHYHTLACDKFGSRVLDVLWLAASERQQGILVEKLMTHRSMLENNFFGKFALKNFRPRHRQQQDQRENRKRSFMEILEE